MNLTMGIFFATAVHAAGESADIELVHMTISPQSMPGIESPFIGEFGSMHIGLQSQYIRDPLVLYANNQDQGAVVARKQRLDLGFGFDFSKRVGVQLYIPSALQWGSDKINYTRDGYSLGDIRANIRIAAITQENLNVGFRGEFFLPTSAAGAWMGETQLRGGLTTIIQAKRKNIELMSELGSHLRPSVNTEQDFILGNEILTNVGVRWHLWPDNFAIGTAVLARFGTVNFLNGGAENSSELLTFIQGKGPNSTLWQVGTAKGLSEGYGTSEYRAFAQISYHRYPPVPKPAFSVTKLPDDPPEPDEIEEPDIEEPEWEEEELAKIEEDQIFIRDAIQFELGTDTLLEESLPTLTFVAKLINEDIQIGHLVIEGHASEEGSYDYNYKLSNLRARAIYRALVEAGVHPDRLSHRGYGEAIPVTKGEDEASLARNRRVEFHIVRQDPTTGSDYKRREVQTKPWDGSPLQSVEPEPQKQPSDEDEEEIIIQNTEEGESE